MKLAQVQRDTLLKPLQAVTGIVEKRHTLPILSNVLLRAADDTIDLLATDLEIQISSKTKVERKNTEPLALTVSARKFQDILRALPDGSDLVLDAQTNRLQVKAGKHLAQVRLGLGLPPVRREPRTPLLIITS